MPADFWTLEQLAFVPDARSPRPLLLSPRQLADRWVLAAVVGTALPQVVAWPPLAGQAWKLWRWRGQPASGDLPPSPGAK